MESQTRLHQGLFWLLILLLPTQLGFHFWPSWASIFGIRVDYLSPTIYLTDLIVVGILVSWVAEKLPPNFQFPIFKLKIPKIFLVTILYLFFTSILIAQNQGAALYKLVKLIEFILLGIYISQNKVLFTNHSSLIAVPLFYSSLVAWAQFVLQRTIGGPLWLLGERTFTASTPGIALFTFSGQEFLRPYATFPHPNVLAGFLLVVAILLFQKSKINFGSIFIFVLGGLAFFLSFSHSAWIAAVVVFFVAVVPYLRRRIFWVIKLALVLSVFVGLAAAAAANNRLYPQEISQRLELSGAALEMFKEKPLTGVGLNNFVVALPKYAQSPTTGWWLQPVHNLFLLALAETGIIGLGLLVWALGQMDKWIDRFTLSSTQLSITLAFLAILLTGISDHYWLTVQQGQLLATLVVSLFWGAGKSTSGV